MPENSSTAKSRHFEDFSLRYGFWLVDQQDQIYIIPKNEYRVVGPENEICKKLNAIVRQTGVLTMADCRQMGLDTVPGVVRRFNPEIGYHSAIRRRSGRACS